jgi:acyl carrier protein
VDSEKFSPTDKLRDLLRGFPESTVQACAEFQQTRSAEAFDRAFAGVIEHHLRQPPPQPVAQMPGSTQLVADLGLDSLTMVEMAFLFEDLFATQVPHEDYIKIVTLDDLRGLLRSKIPGLNPA